MEKDKVLTGAAGEYYVAFQLSARGYAVGLTARGTKSADLLVTNLETGKSATIQVKTMSKAFVQPKNDEPYWKWRVRSPQVPTSKTFLYAFVDLKNNISESPDVFIVPSSQLTKLVYEWKDNKEKVRDSWLNIQEKEAQKYRNRWDVIENVLT